jgi:hypothetical protein
MAEFFNRVAEEVQLAADELQTLFSGSISSGGGAGGGSAQAGGDSGSYAHDFDMSDMDLDGMSEEEIQSMLAEEIMKNNPLQGIADGVTKDIMSGQVRRVANEDNKTDNGIIDIIQVSSKHRDSSMTEYIRRL